MRKITVKVYVFIVTRCIFFFKCELKIKEQDTKDLDFNLRYTYDKPSCKLLQ